jgi:ankyrin repeat protein
VKTAIRANNLNQVIRYINRGVKPSFNDFDAIALYNRVEIFSYLLDQNLIDPSLTNHHIDIFASFCSQGCSTIVHRMLESDLHLDINAHLGNNKTSLHYAANFGCLATTQLLVEAGADLSVVDQDGKSPLYFAAANDHVDVFDYLVRMGMSIEKDKHNLFRLAITNKAYDMAEYLIRHGADLFQKDNDGREPLAWAARYCDLDMVKLIYDAADDPTLHDVDKALLNINYWLGEGTLKIRFFVEHGANVNARHTNGDSLLNLVCAMYIPELIRLFIEHGADVNQKNDNGNTAIYHLALPRKDRPETTSEELALIELLIDHGANLNDYIDGLREIRDTILLDFISLHEDKLDADHLKKWKSMRLPLIMK